MSVYLRDSHVLKANSDASSVRYVLRESKSCQAVESSLDIVKTALLRFDYDTRRREPLYLQGCLHGPTSLASGLYHISPTVESGEDALPLHPIRLCCLHCSPAY